MGASVIAWSEQTADGVLMMHYERGHAMSAAAKALCARVDVVADRTMTKLGRARGVDVDVFSDVGGIA